MKHKQMNHLLFKFNVIISIINIEHCIGCFTKNALLPKLLYTKMRQIKVVKQPVLHPFSYSRVQSKLQQLDLMIILLFIEIILHKRYIYKFSDLFSVFLQASS